MQAYLSTPLLIHKRKFDIRVFGLVTSVYGKMRGYFYEDGYLRTSSKEFQLGDLGNKYIHLTNDAIQKRSEDYGKFENGNKLSYADFQKYLESPDYMQQATAIPHVVFTRDIVPQMRHLVAQAFRSVSLDRLDPHRRLHSFEVFGFDFMLDEQFTVYLIEANTNPCLEVNGCPVLARIIPQMLDSAFRVAVDPVLTPPDMNFKRGSEMLHECKFQHIFELEEELADLQALYAVPDDVDIDLETEGHVRS